jgi:hypothetical protein
MRGLQRRQHHIERTLEGRADKAQGGLCHAPRSGSSQGKKQHLCLRAHPRDGRDLGRYLLPDETVHHLNGVRDDNRPENLEIWVRPQPSGVRAEDALAWAREIISRYGNCSHLQQRSETSPERSWRWGDSNPRPRPTIWVFYGRSHGIMSRLRAPRGRGPVGQPEFDVRRWPSGATTGVSLLTTPTPRRQAPRGGRLPKRT